MQNSGRSLPQINSPIALAFALTLSSGISPLASNITSLTPALAQEKSRFTPYQPAPVNSPNYHRDSEHSFQLNTQQIAVLPAVSTLAKTPIASVLVGSLCQAAINIETPKNVQTSGQSMQRENQAAKMAMVLPNAVKNRIMYRPATATARTYLGSQTGQTEVDVQAQTLQLEQRKTALNLRLLTALLQIVQGMGELESSANADNKIQAESLIKEGEDTLTALAGAGQAKWATDKLTLWAKKLKEENAYQGESALSNPISPLAEQDEAAKTTSECLAADPEIHNIKALLGIHDVAPSAVERTLSTVSMVPLIFTKIASVAQAGVESGSGGGRISRLAHVVNLGQRLDNRSTFISQKVQLLMHMDNFAHSRQNGLLSAFARETLAALRQGK